MKQLHLLSGGAAQGLVARLQEGFLARHSSIIQANYGAVGFMRDRLLGGDPCDVVVLTQALVEQLTLGGHLVPGSARALGVVRTGIAVQSGEDAPPVTDRATLKGALLAARGVYFPDPVKATAGIHFMKVLQQLGVDVQLGPKLHTFPNGAAAMKALAQATGPRLIGCTQVTEILHAPGVKLVAPLPQEFELATVYTAAVCTGAGHPQTAEEFVSLLSGDAAASVRRECGFE